MVNNGHVGYAISSDKGFYKVFYKAWHRAIKQGTSLVCPDYHPCAGKNIVTAVNKEGLIMLDAWDVVGACDPIVGKLKYYFYKNVEHANYEDFISRSDESGTMCMGNLGEYKTNGVYREPGVYTVNLNGTVERARLDKTMGDSKYYRELIRLMITMREVHVNTKVVRQSTKFRYDSGIMKMFPEFADISNKKLDFVPGNNFKMLLYDIPSEIVHVGSVVKCDSCYYLVTKFKENIDSTDHDGRVWFVLRAINRRVHFIPNGVP
jgi:hypothetical protein